MARKLLFDVGRLRPAVEHSGPLPPKGRTSGGRGRRFLGDAQATLGDIRALVQHDFEPTPRELYVTDPLAAVLPDARVEILAGQAHEGMTTAPEAYVASVTRFLLS